jgi:hypothetical protein
MLYVLLYNHKVLTYVEYRAVSGVFQNIDPPPPPPPPSVCVYPPHRRRRGGGGVHTRRAGWGGGVNILEDANIGLAYSLYVYNLAYNAHVTNAAAMQLSNQAIS